MPQPQSSEAVCSQTQNTHADRRPPARRRHSSSASFAAAPADASAAAAAAGAAAGAAAAAVQRVPDNGPLLAALYALHERHRHAYYSRLHGDKETFWLACELLPDGAARRTADSPVSS